MKYKISLLLVAFIIVLFSCNSEKSQEKDSLGALEKAVEEVPNGESISKLLTAYNSIILDKTTARNTLKKTLDKAYKLTKEQGWEKELISFASTYLKEFPEEKDNEDKILLLIELMEKRNQKVTTEALKFGFLEAYPTSEMNDSFRSVLDPEIESYSKYLDKMAARVFENAGDIGVNVLNAREYVNACEASALVLPSKLNTPRYLFNAAEISRTIKTYDKTLYLYDWVVDKYPQYEKAPMALFLKGFVLENEMNNIDVAKETYRSFIEKYPAHDLTDDVQFLLDNIGKSNEEILNMIEKNKEVE